MSYCLIPSLAQKFKEVLDFDTIKKLNAMSSQERHTFFAGVIGENDAKNVNALFESKLLLKNQQKGMITWAKTVSGLKPEIKRDIFTTINRLDKVLNPEEEKAFLNDLVNKRLGVDVTMEEAKNIHDLAKGIEDTKTGMNADGVTFKSETDRLKYGAAKTALNEYMKDLKSSAMNLTKEAFKNKPIKSFTEALSQASGTFKSVTAAMDNSGIFRQGWKTLWTNPGVWKKNAIQSFKDIWNSIGGKNTINSVYADGFSRENALNGYYKKARLAVGVTEEAYPSTIPEKIPYYNKLYKASEHAYAGFLYRQRMDIFDKYIDVAKKSGVELSNEELGSIGKMVNSLTGRGDLGFVEPVADKVNSIFFSPRLIKSHIDTLGGQIITGAGGSNFVRKQAAINLLKIVSGTAAILTVAKAFNPDSVSLDPRSPDFGKIRIKNTRFDVTGGMGSIVTLAARLSPTLNKGKWGFYSKSSTTGKVSALNSGAYGSQNVGDVIYSFGENKLSPAAALVDHIWLKGRDFQGNKPTVIGEASNLVVPLGIQNTYQTLKSPDSGLSLLVMIADGLGISANTYLKKK